jgi:glycosyltransferase involved in cell wall biosynthesis
VIENVVRAQADSGKGRVPGAGGALRVGFFGQLSFLKGANVLFDAARRLDKDERWDIGFEIFGDYRSQPPDFQKELLERMAEIGENVKFHGSYDESRVDALMQSMDAVIVPSVWWENSPLVIQEALRNGRPVICSDIGGMAEKVRDGVDGFHFHAGSAMDLVALLKRLADDRGLLADVAGTLRTPDSVSDTVDVQLLLYRSLPALVGESRADARRHLGDG